MPSFGSATSAVSTSASFSVAKPAGTVDGDLLIAWQANDSGSMGLSGGSTWTELTSGNGGGNTANYRVAIKIAGSSEPTNYTATQPAGNDCHVSILRISSGSTTVVWAVNAAGQSGTSISTPSVTPAGAADLLVRLVAGQATNTSGLVFTAPASHTRQTNAQSGNWLGGATATRELASSAATGTASFTTNLAVQFAVGLTIAVTNASVPATIEAVPVTAAADVPVSVVGIGSDVHVATVDAGADVPAPSVVAVTAGEIAPVTVTATADVPDPAITAIRQAVVSLETADAQGLVSSPSVSVPVLPGESITRDGQVEWGYTALWGWNAYSVREITGWVDQKPQMDDLSVEEAFRHGALAGTSYAKRRIVTIKLQVNSVSDPTQITALLRQLRYDTRTLRDNTLWPLVIRGRTETLMATGKVIDRTGVMDADWSAGVTEPVITIMCPDPRVYSLEQQSTVIGVGDMESLVNDGDCYTSPILRFTGPATNPAVLNETLDRVLAFNITLTDGQRLDVDTQRGKVLIGDVNYMRYLADTVSVPPKEFFLDVGSSDLSYETDAGGGAGVEVIWRSASL